jgi:DNA-binding beta-propeller fold protein YncE
MRSPFLRAVSLFAAILLAVGTRAALAQDELFVTNGGNDSVTVYTRTANGNIAPLRTISGGATGLSTPRGLAVDTVNNELAVANSLSPPSITVYALTANGNVAPLRTISGAATGLTVNTVGLAVDTVNNEFFVTIGASLGPSVLVFSRTANGNVAPLRTISGAATGLIAPYGVAVDIVNNEVAVANLSGNSVTVYSRTANGNVAPLRTISGAATGLNGPLGLAVDTVNNELAAATSGGDSVRVYARTANGNVAPLRTISGAATGLSGPVGLAVDTVNNELAVVNLNASVTVYTRTANGNVAPLRTLQGAATGFNIPLFVGITTGGAGPTPTSPPGTSTPTPTSPPATPTPTPTSPLATPTPTSPPAPTPTPLPGGVVVPTLDVRGQIALMLILAAIGILAIRRMNS